MKTLTLITICGILCVPLMVRAAGAPGGATSSAKDAPTVDLSPLETRVLGQSRWLRGGPAGLRVIVSDHRSGQPLHASVTLSLTRLVNDKPTASSYWLFHGETSRLGTLNARFHTPPAPPGSYRLNVAVRSPLGQDSVDEPIQLQESRQILLTADKPIYQPGQTMHLRALALDMATREAVAGAPLTFEVEDARGNKVFKQTIPLSAFGLASTDFVLADEVNMGTFTLRAILSDNQAEKKVRVDRYVLPKFKVSLTTDRSYYLPGETVHGSIDAHYFFGKPVAGGEVNLAVNTIDVGVTRLSEIHGATDAQGKYQFDYQLPATFVGQPFEQGKAVVEFDGSLKDTADHKQQINTTVPVVQNAVSLVMVPEKPSLVPDVLNRVYIAAAAPDNTPLRGLPLEVSGDRGEISTRISTDDMGIAVFSFIPGRQPVTLKVAAADATGRPASASQTLTTANTQDGVILRTDRSLARVGDQLQLTGLSTTRGGTLYLDVVRDKQTILTQSAPLINGRARINLPVTEDMVGTLELHAYKVLPNEDIVRDSRTVIVSPADDLQVHAAADKLEYRPGEDAVLRFSVQDQGKHPVLAALGVAIVDESVFALSEFKPGLEKIYFMLEKELMEPRYEIHGLSPAGLLLGPLPREPAGSAPQTRRSDSSRTAEANRQQAAAMLFAAAPSDWQFDIHANTYQQRWEKVKEQTIEEMQKLHQKILQALQKYRTENHVSLTAAESLFLLVDRGYLKASDLRDPWGHYYLTNLYGSGNYDGYFTLSSAGPDGIWGTTDDIQEAPVFNRRGGILFRERELGGFGGGGGMQFGAVQALGVPAPPMAAPVMLKTAIRAGFDQDGALVSNAAAPAAQPVRVREYFPETMYWNPAILTDEHGQAQVRVPMADSITTWRVSMMANTPQGQLGSATAPIKVFQDFFVDLDLPVSLTQNDRVDLPVTVYNYLPTSQDVTLTLGEQPWFVSRGPAVQSLKIDAGQVKVVYFPITVQSIGRFPLTVTARGTHLSDAVRRVVEVLPDGKEVRTTVNDRLEGSVQKTVSFPAEAIPGARTIWVKLYPGSFSQVVEGLDGMLRMPNGCFEQTSSTTYPNVLILAYLKGNKRINPELQLKAEQYINVGYQRLVTFECKNGGFSWFGNDPANQILTAYGLLEFSDMAKVYTIDPRLIERTRLWLASHQKGDFTWDETGQGIAEGIINRQTGALRTTAYICWALAESGYQGPQLDHGVQYVKAHRGEARDPYTLAVILNLLSVVDRDGEATGQVANDLIALAKTTDKTAYWQTDSPTFTGADGKGGDLETTGLAAYGLAKWGRNAGFTTKVLTQLVQSKDSFGAWGSTQGTVWSLKALLYASGNAMGGGKGTVSVIANGQKVQTFDITPENSDVMRQLDLGKQLREDNDIRLEYQGEGSLLYQIVGRYYLPWERLAPVAETGGPLSLNVAYDKTTLARDDTATVTVTIRNTTDRQVEMPLIDVGVPPGFDVVPDQLEAAVQAKTISKYSVAARQVILYLEKLEPGQTETVTYQVKARFPIKARTPLSKAYPYYNPERETISAPQDIIVQ